MHVEGAVDLSKMAVLSDLSVFVPPFYALDLDVDKVFDLQRVVSSIHLYIYLPRTPLSLSTGNLISLVDSAEVNERCVVLSKNSRVSIETGVAKSNHVTLEVPSKTEVYLIEKCSSGETCVSRELTSDSHDSEPIRTLTPVSMSMTRVLHKAGFHRELETKIQLSNTKVNEPL